MHETFVTGPIGTLGLRLAERCEECARTSQAEGCSGFGAGCLVMTQAEAQDYEEHETPSPWAPRRPPRD